MTEIKDDLAFVFPGQGSQSVGMLAELASEHSEIEQIFAQASAVLDLDLWQLVSSGPADSLNMTENTQPAMLAAGVAVWQLWCKLSPLRPAWMAGHSLGEYTALVCAGALAFEDALRLVAKRAYLMQRAVPAGDGAMAAILGMEDALIIDLCRQIKTGQVVSAVNFNAPGQIVIAGHTEAVQAAMQLARDAGAKRAVELPVSVPSHCSLMQPAAEELAGSIQATSFNAPEITVVHNVDAQPHATADEIRDVLMAQLHQPVRWVDSVRYMMDQSVTDIVECGPGKVLSGLNKRIDRSIQCLPVFDVKTLEKVQEALV